MSQDLRYYTMMNDAAVTEQLKQTQEMLGKLLALLESSQADKFVAHLYQARKPYRLICERCLGEDRFLRNLAWMPVSNRHATVSISVGYRGSPKGFR
jgi:hypothetical protein